MSNGGTNVAMPSRVRDFAVRTPARLPLLMVAVLLCAAVLAPRSVRANGVPTRIDLSYLANLSNFGPSTATGQAELSYAEGIIRIDARGLQPLDKGAYGVWLVKSSANSSINVGFFNAAGDGSATYSGKLPQLTDYDYDLILLTAQPIADTSVPPTDQRAIGGYYTPIQKPDSNPQVAADTQPGTLPNTGDLPDAAIATPPPAGNPDARRHEMAAAFFAVGLLGLYGTYRLRRRAE
jgi:hypothetical protein